MEYWYTAQLRNYRLQFIRAFSNIFYKTGKSVDGVEEIVRVPCRYGDPTRIAEMVVRANSENKILTVPFIACTVAGLNMSPDRRQDPMLVERIQVDERAYDENKEKYLNTPGNRYTVERYMPVPYILNMEVSLWSNNTSVKEQILEQILTLYNPAIEFQTSNNPLDWTVLSYIEMQDTINWTSRSIPIGTENPIDVLTLGFRVPIWINPPAKVKKQQIIENIITNIISGSREEDAWDWTEYEFLNRKIVTPGDFSIRLRWLGNNQYSISLVSRAGDPVDYQRQATVTFSKVNPTLTPGLKFTFNGITIPINSSSINEFVDNTQSLLRDTGYYIQMQNLNQIMFINNSGEDNVFTNVTGDPLIEMGLLPTTYPGGDWAWWRLFLAYGTLQPYALYGANASQLRLKVDIENPTAFQAIGYIDQDPINQNLIIWRMDPDTIPGPTLPAITAIVNPQDKGPNFGLPGPYVGQRYLLTEKPATSSAAWGTLDAEPDDIIEFNGTNWQVSFVALDNVDQRAYVINQFTGKLLIWDGRQWAEYILPGYQPGYWRLAL